MKRTFEREMAVIEIKGLIKETENLFRKSRFNLGVDTVESLNNDLDKVTNMINFIRDKVDTLLASDDDEGDEEALY